MLSQHLIPRFAAFVLTLFSLSALVVAQSKQVKPPEERTRKIKSEANDAYKRWATEDVESVIRPEEEAAYKKLKTDAEREAFIGEFWRIRDPDPDTQENEYREEHYERLAYANEHFSSGKPGRTTDRGRIYIKFGKPDEIEGHPSGGQYQRLSYEGRGSATTYPFEKWFYRYLPGVGSGIEIEFVDPTGSGEYRIARDFTEKEVMAHAPEVSPGSESGYQREQDSPFARADQLRKLDQAPEIARKYLDGSTGSPKIDNNPLNFDIRADYFKLSDNRVLTAFTIQAENKDLSFADSGGLLTARLNIFGTITGVTERRVGSFEDIVTTTATAQELTEAQERRSAYSKVTILAPGNYRADVVVRDIKSGATGVRHFGFEVPKYEEGKLATSSMILAAKLENLEGEAIGQFVIGQTKVVPNLSGQFHRGQPVGVYLQLYNAGIDQTTLRPSVDVEYALLKDGKVLRTQVEDWKGISDSGKRLTLARLLETKTLAPGDYEVAIRVHDGVSGQALAQSAKFTVVEQ